MNVFNNEICEESSLRSDDMINSLVFYVRNNTFNNSDN